MLAQAGRATSLPLSSRNDLRPINADAVAEIVKDSFKLLNSSQIALAPQRERDPTLDEVGVPLVLDIRPYSAYAQSRLPCALSICVPSTLLKRPTYSLQKLSDVITSTGRETVSPSERLSKYAMASSIIIYDMQNGGLMSAVNSRGVKEGTSCWHIANKFRQAGYTKEIYYLQGGFEQFEQEQGDLVDASSITSSSQSSSPPSTNGLGQCRSSGLAGHLLSRPTSGRTSAPLARPTSMKIDFVNNGPKTANVGGGAMEGLGFGSLMAESPSSIQQSNRAEQRFSGSAAAANPFFDNIRQNTELRGGLGELIAVRLPPALPSASPERLASLPRSLKEAIDLESGARRLAEQFYHVEKDEQRRLQEVMMYHSSTSRAGSGFESGSVSRSGSGSSDTSALDEAGQTSSLQGQLGESLAEIPSAMYPFSICAAVEQGNKNRYNNIWPYEHTRVKLKAMSEDDYFNASFIQMPGSTQRYVATQGPLPTTFQDFWSVIWDQDVSVIVMLTKEEEGGRVKCHRYWAEGQDEVTFGHFRLKSIARRALDKDGQSCTYSYSNKENGLGGGGFFADTLSSNLTHRSIIERTFLLEHLAEDLPPRKVIQLQYTGWPDYDIPDVPADMLRLHALTHQAHQEIKERSNLPNGTQESTTTLVHCSAGVGRTGSFIVLETAIDLLERNAGLGSFGMDWTSEGANSGTRGSETPATDLTRRFDTLASTDLPRKANADGERRPEDDPYLILKILKAIRKQRMSLVQTLRQYVFTHEALIAYLLEKEQEQEQISQLGAASAAKEIQMV